MTMKILKANISMRADSVDFIDCIHEQDTLFVTSTSAVIRGAELISSKLPFRA
jgi:hypothetical protein